MSAPDELCVVRTDKATGHEARGPARGLQWAGILRRVALAEGHDKPTVEVCAAIARRLLVDRETIHTSFASYRVVSE